MPVNADGRDHRETCVGKTAYSRRCYMDANHEDATQAFLRRTQGSTRKKRGQYPFSSAPAER